MLPELLRGVSTQKNLQKVIGLEIGVQTDITLGPLQSLSVSAPPTLEVEIEDSDAENAVPLKPRGSISKGIGGKAKAEEVIMAARQVVMETRKRPCGTEVSEVTDKASTASENKWKRQPWQGHEKDLSRWPTASESRDLKRFEDRKRRQVD